MRSFLKRFVLRPIPYVFTDRIGGVVNKLFLRNLKKQLLGKVTYKFLELLLKGLDLTFHLSKGFRKNIRNFKGKYLFVTADNTVAASAIFSGGNMKVDKNAIDDWDIRVTFKNYRALLDFLFSKDQDILNSLLKNEVEVDGNLNYIYKFGFMARDLSRRLGVN